MEQLINLAKKFILQPKEAWEIVKDDTATAQQHLDELSYSSDSDPDIATFIGHGFIGMGIDRSFIKMGIY